MREERTLLHGLFERLVEQVFAGQLRVRDPRPRRYLTALLAEFAHRDRLYRLRDASGRPLEQVAEMLLESDVLLHAASFDRERQVHKHIGDFTLFVSGVWPEWHARLAGSADALLDFRATGKRSYYIASTFQHDPFTEEAAVLRRLSAEFELYQFGLNLVRSEMDRLGHGPADGG